MEYSTLYELISMLQYGTKLHIGVLFFGDFGGEAMRLPREHLIHSGAVCWEFKERENGYRRCYRCRQMAIRKAQREQRDFGGYCINGVYEYTRPVVIDGNVAAMIYIGNIALPGNGCERLLNALGDRRDLIETMERSFDEERCRSVGKLIESYIRALADKYPPRRTDSLSVVENAKGYIESNLEFNVSLADIARIFHYNAQYLGRLFKSETGKSFAEYLNCARIKRAEQALSTDRSIIDIAASVGFNNVTYFNRLFKRRYGVSPTEYRKKPREANLRPKDE